MSANGTDISFNRLMKATLGTMLQQPSRFLLPNSRLLPSPAPRFTWQPIKVLRIQATAFAGTRRLIQKAHRLS